jgi:NO-binding membrane sensor protein with MHYT domain
VFELPIGVGDEQNWWLLLLAGLVCIHASLTAITLFNRACLRQGSTRALWVVVSGVTAGCGIWATHLIVTLPSAASYDVGLAVLSLATALTVTTLGLAFAVYGPARWNAPIGGAIVGSGIAGMTCLGIAALNSPGQVTWYLDFVVVSAALAILFGTASLAVAARGHNTRTTMTASALLVFAICANQIMAMGALKIVSDPSQVAEMPC